MIVVSVKRLSWISKICSQIDVLIPFRSEHELHTPALPISHVNELKANSSRTILESRKPIVFSSEAITGTKER